MNNETDFVIQIFCNRMVWLCAGVCSSVLPVLKMNDVDQFSKIIEISRSCHVSGPGFF